MEFGDSDAKTCIICKKNLASLGLLDYRSHIESCLNKSDSESEENDITEDKSDVPNKPTNSPEQQITPDDSHVAIEFLPPYASAVSNASSTSGSNADLAEHVLATEYRPLTDTHKFLALLANPERRSTDDLYRIAENVQNALVEWQREYERIDSIMFQQGLQAKKKVNPRIHDPEQPFDFIHAKTLESRRVGGRDLRRIHEDSPKVTAQQNRPDMAHRTRRSTKKFEEDTAPVTRKRGRPAAVLPEPENNQDTQPPKKRKGRPPGIKGRYWGAKAREMKRREEMKAAGLAVAEEGSTQSKMADDGIIKETQTARVNGKL